MANQLYGSYTTTGYGGAAAASSNISDQYLPGDSTSLFSDPYSSAYSSVTDRVSSTLYGHSDAYSAASRSSWPGPPGVDVASSAVDPLAGLKRTSALECKAIFVFLIIFLIVSPGCCLFDECNVLHLGFLQEQKNNEIKCHIDTTFL